MSPSQLQVLAGSCCSIVESCATSPVTLESLMLHGRCRQIVCRQMVKRTKAYEGAGHNEAYTGGSGAWLVFGANSGQILAVLAEHTKYIQPAVRS
jgi:hypothetical protein